MLEPLFSPLPPSRIFLQGQLANLVKRHVPTPRPRAPERLLPQLRVEGRDPPPISDGVDGRKGVFGAEPAQGFRGAEKLRGRAGTSAPRRDFGEALQANRAVLPIPKVCEQAKTAPVEVYRIPVPASEHRDPGEVRQ